ncbi:MAG: hypothetical protein WCE75_02875 [Terracidiphilus sp.]
MLFGIASDAGTPLWKKVAFVVLVLIAALVLYVRRSRPQHQFMFSVLLAVIAVLFVLVIYVLR